MPFDTRDASRNKAAPLEIRLVAGNSNRPLADAISGILKMPLAKSVVRRFASTELHFFNLPDLAARVQHSAANQIAYIIPALLQFGPLLAREFAPLADRLTSARKCFRFGGGSGSTYGASGSRPACRFSRTSIETGFHCHFRDDNARCRRIRHQAKYA